MQLSSPPPIDTCLELLQRCRSTCEHCSESRLTSTALGTAALRCLRLMVQCAELCGDTAQLLGSAPERDVSTLRNHVRSCAIACERCRREIERAGFAWAEECVDVCARAAEACHDLLPTLPLEAPRASARAFHSGRSD